MTELERISAIGNTAVLTLRRVSYLPVEIIREIVLLVTGSARKALRARRVLRDQSRLSHIVRFWLKKTVRGLPLTTNVRQFILMYARIQRRWVTLWDPGATDSALSHRSDIGLNNYIANQ